MAIAFVQGANSSGIVSVALTGVTAGSLLVFCTAQQGAGGLPAHVTAITDTNLNTWTHIAAADSVGVSAAQTTEIWYAKNVASGNTTVSPVYDNTVAGGDIFVAEFSGVDITSPLETGANVSAPSVGHASGPALTPSNATDLLVSVILPNSGSGAGAQVNVPWTVVAIAASDDPAGYYIPGMTGTFTMQTILSGNQNYLSSGAIFIAAPSGPSEAVKSGAFLTYD